MKTIKINDSPLDPKLPLPSPLDLGGEEEEEEEFIAKLKASMFSPAGGEHCQSHNSTEVRRD